MDSKERITSDLLVAIAGILMFISLEQVIKINGYAKYAWVLLVLGLWLFYFPMFWIMALDKLRFVNDKVIYTLAHILIFIGLAVYTRQYIEQYWWAFTILGVILINYSKKLAGTVFHEEGL